MYRGTGLDCDPGSHALFRAIDSSLSVPNDSSVLPNRDDATALGAQRKMASSGSVPCPEPGLGVISIRHISLHVRDCTPQRQCC